MPSAHIRYLFFLTLYLRSTVGGVVDDGQAVPRSWSGSGGGFSDFFPQPTFMQIAHRGYLNNPANNIPPRSSFNQTGRGYPE